MVRFVRESRPGLRQEDLVEAARSLGLDWSRTSVTQLEAGRRQLSAEELLLLPQLLRIAAGGLTGPDVAELLSVDLARRHKLTGARRLRIGSIEVGDRTVRGFLAGRTAESHAIEDSGSVTHVEGLPLQLLAADPKAGEAERKAARNLKISPTEVVALSLELWGQTLSSERDERLLAGGAEGARPQSVQALRGHITRTLLHELKSFIVKEGADRGTR